MRMAVALLGLAAAATPAGEFAGTSAVWDGMLHVPVRCGLSTGTCAGSLTVRAPGETSVLAASEYRIAAGATRSVLVDPGAAASQRIMRLTSIDARLSTAQGEEARATLRVVHRRSGSSGPASPSREVLAVHDRRGDGVRRLDLRKVTVRIAHRRLILRFVCWRTFGPADMDHDVANFHAFVGLRASEPPRHRFIALFFAHGHPFTQAGASLFPNHRVRYSRPDRHSARLSVPVSVFGHPKRLWIYPATFGNPRGEDRAPRLNVRVR
jgi:hypothetical protein